MYLNDASQPWMRGREILMKKRKSAFVIKRHLSELRAICVVRDVRGTLDTVRPNIEHISPRRVDFIGRKIHYSGLSINIKTMQRQFMTSRDTMDVL